MAHIQTKYCYECCWDTTHTNGKCNACKGREAENRHREHFARLDSLSLEERVREIEKQLYNLNINPPWGDNICY